MERLDIEALIEEYGQEDVLKTLVDYCKDHKVSNEMFEFFARLGHEKAYEILSDNTVMIRNKEYSFKTLRPLLLNVSVHDFKIAATVAIEAAWWQPLPLVSIHSLIRKKTHLTKISQTQLGIMIRIIFANSGFSYCTKEGYITIKKRKSNTYTRGTCLQLAINSYVDIKNGFHNTLSDIKYVIAKSIQVTGDEFEPDYIEKKPETLLDDLV